MVRETAITLSHNPILHNHIQSSSNDLFKARQRMAMLIGNGNGYVPRWSDCVELSMKWWWEAPTCLSFAQSFLQSVGSHILSLSWVRRMFARSITSSSSSTFLLAHGHSQGGHWSLALVTLSRGVGGWGHRGQDITDHRPWSHNDHWSGTAILLTLLLHCTIVLSVLTVLSQVSTDTMVRVLRWWYSLAIHCHQPPSSAPVACLLSLLPDTQPPHHATTQHYYQQHILHS